MLYCTCLTFNESILYSQLSSHDEPLQSIHSQVHHAEVTAASLRIQQPDWLVSRLFEAPTDIHRELTISQGDVDEEEEGAML